MIHHIPLSAHCQNASILSNYQFYDLFQTWHFYRVWAKSPLKLLEHWSSIQTFAKCYTFQYCHLFRERRVNKPHLFCFGSRFGPYRWRQSEFAGILWTFWWILKLNQFGLVSFSIESRHRTLFDRLIRKFQNNQFILTFSFWIV